MSLLSWIRSMQKASANIFYLLPGQTIYCACLTVYGSDNICATGKIGIGQRLIKENSLDPGKALIIGDTLHDAEVAKALGINCILYSGGHNNYNLLTKKSKVIRNLKDILPH